VEKGVAMRSSFAVGAGLPLARTPSVRQQAARRRLVAVGAILGLALISGVFGAVTAPRGPDAAPTGPFSYFPSE
jgi:hypothetical protein